MSAIYADGLGTIRPGNRHGPASQCVGVVTVDPQSNEMLAPPTERAWQKTRSYFGLVMGAQASPAVVAHYWQGQKTDRKPKPSFPDLIKSA